MFIFKKILQGEKKLNKALILLILLSFNCKEKEYTDYCNLEKNYMSVIHFGEVTKNSPKRVRDKVLSNKIGNHIEERYGVNSFEKEKIYILDQEHYVFDFTPKTNDCKDVMFFGVYDKLKNVILITNLKQNKSNLLRYEIKKDSTISIFKKIVVETGNDFVEKNCLIDFSFKNNDIYFTLDDNEEFTKW